MFIVTEYAALTVFPLNISINVRKPSIYLDIELETSITISLITVRERQHDVCQLKIGVKKCTRNRQFAYAKAYVSV